MPPHVHNYLQHMRNCPKAMVGLILKPHFLMILLSDGMLGADLI